jgi:hypothetical protein
MVKRSRCYSASGFGHPMRRPQLIKETATTTLLLLCTVMGFAQTPQTFGGWSVYSLDSRHGQATNLLQTRSLEQDEDAQRQPVVLKLDAVCKGGKLYQVAVETDTPVAKHATNFSGAVPTTRVSFQANGNGPEVQSWAVLDGGHTVSPYSELMQGKRNHSWIERLAGTDTLTLEFRGGSQQDTIHARFNTTGISQALAAVGCTY